jgi:hypothetical protein
METVIIKSVTDGRTDGEPDGHRHTIIRPVFNGRIKIALATQNKIKQTKTLY